MKTILITGATGLIGTEVVAFFHDLGVTVHGVDNNQRAAFFGPSGDTSRMARHLTATLANYQHHALDIRDRAGMLTLCRELKPDVIVHTAGQPSHDLAARIPFYDFETNATGSLNLLEAARQACPDVPFIHLSTNKVRKQVYTYVEESRIGDPICSYCDQGKMQTHYPAWGGTESLRDIVTEVVGSWRERLGT